MTTRLSPQLISYSGLKDKHALTLSMAESTLCLVNPHRLISTGAKDIEFCNKLDITKNYAHGTHKFEFFPATAYVKSPMVCQRSNQRATAMRC